MHGRRTIDGADTFRMRTRRAELSRPCHRRTVMRLPVTLVSTLVLALLVAGCAGTSTTPSPTPEPVPVTSPEQAVARVIATEPRLTGIGPFDQELIGQGSWYKVAAASGVGAFVVEVRVGWGDCQASCISEHRWVYAVGPDGAVSIVSQEGEPVPDEAWPAPGAAGRTGIGGKVTAGPVCPVEKNPPDPACAPRPVAGAVLLIRLASGAEVARVTTDAAGTFFADVPAGGYVVEPQTVDGLMGTAGPQSVTVNEGVTSRLDFGYDTGIR